MKDIYIVNSKAGKDSFALRFAEKIRQYHAQSKTPFEVLETEYAGHGEILAREAAEKGEEVCLWAVGGDGTLLEVVRGAAYHPHVSVGVFPCGSGNDFIRTLGSREDFLNIGRQMRGTAVLIDMIRSENGDAVNICSMGFDAKVAERMTHFKHLPAVSGELTYTLSLVKCLFGRLADAMTVVITNEKGEKETFSGEFMFSLAGNGQWYGGGYRGAPKAVLNDGLLDFVLIRKPALRRVPLLVGKYKRGEHLDAPAFSDLLIYRRGTKIEMRGESEMVSNMDGNCVRTKHESYTVLPGALRLMVPEGIVLL